MGVIRDGRNMVIGVKYKIGFYRLIKVERLGIYRILFLVYLCFCFLFRSSWVIEL